MKIYPKAHELISTTDVKHAVDIPIAYINSDEYTYDYTIDNKFNKNEKTSVLPYDTFDKNDMLFFDEFLNPIYGLDVLIRQDAKYMFFPKNAKTFIPDTFNYSVVCKKNFRYNTSKSYNIKISCIDDEELSFSKHMMQYFGDANKRGICKKNITINNGDMALNSLVDTPKEDSDFLLIKIKDGKDINGEDIDYNKFLESNTNMWLFIDDFDDIIKRDETIMYIYNHDAPPTITRMKHYTEYKFKDPQLTNKELYTDIYCDIIALREKTNNNIIDIMTTNNKSIKTPLLLIEKNNEGFIIISHSSLMNEPEIIYETLFNVFSRTYAATAERNEWICNIVPDYEAINNKLVKKTSFTSHLPIHSMLNLNKNEVIIVNIKCDNENVQCIPNINGHVDFKLLTAKDPITDKNSIKIYTHRKDIMSIDKNLFTLETPMDIKINIDSNEATIIIGQFSSSYNCINIKEDTVLKLKLKITENYEEKYITDSTFEIYINQGIIKIRQFSSNNDYTNITVLCKIRLVRKKANMNSFDMRVRGGGASIINNEDLFDVCDILGHAYRPGGAYIIKLPSRLKEYNNIIEEEIKKHKVADHHLMILYYDEE